MQKSVNPVVATFVIFIFCGLIAIYIWASSQLLKLDRFGLAKQLNEHQIAFQFGSRLIVSDLIGHVESQFDLKQYHQDFFVGDFINFSNGDLLLSLNQTPPNVHEQIATIMRETNRSDAHSDKTLYRCAPNGSDCRQFSEKLPESSRTFRLFHNSDDDIYLADTSRHKLLKLDASGNIIASKGGFRFPNDIKVIDGYLYVADTNHHTIKQVSTEASNFGQELSSFDVQLASRGLDTYTSLKKEYIWPIAFELVNNEWWVLVGNKNLANARLAIFNKAGDVTRELSLPTDADLISMLKVSNRILLFDVQNYAIYQFNATGQRLENFVLPNLQEEFTQLREASQHWRLLENTCVMLFFILLIIGFTVAIKQHSSNRNEYDLQQLSKRQVRHFVHQDIWLLPRPAFKKIIYAKEIVFLAAIAIYTSLLYTRKGHALFHSSYLYVAIALLFFYFVILYFLNKRLFSVRLGVLADRLIYQIGNKIYTESYDNIIWGDSAIFVKEKLIFTSASNKNNIFDVSELEDHVTWRLPLNNKLSKMQIQWRQFKLQLPMVLLSLGLVVILKVAISIALKSQ